VLARDAGGAVGRAVVDDEHVAFRQLGAQRVEHSGEVRFFVPGRNEDEGVAHDRSRCARTWRLATVDAASSQAIAPGVGAMRAGRKLTATPCAS
jgi:hypothetical protein